MSTLDLAKVNADLGRNAPALVEWALGLGQPAMCRMTASNGRKLVVTMAG